MNHDAWEEVENGALKFTKSGKRFKPSLVVTDAHACIVDCNSDDSDSFSFTGHDKQEHGAFQGERTAKESGNFPDEDASNSPSLAASQILNSHVQTGTQPAPQQLVSRDAVLLQPTGLMDTCRQLPPLALVCSENASPFASRASAISLPSLPANQFPSWHSTVPASMNFSMSPGPEGDQHSFSHSMPDGSLVPHQSEQLPSSCSNMSKPTNILSPFTHDLDAFTQNGGFSADNPYMMPVGLRLGNRFLTGPASVINADNDLDY